MGFVVRLQDRPSLLKVSLESGLVQGAAYWLPQCAACGAPQLPDFGSIGRPSDALLIEPKSGSRGAILRDSISAALGVRCAISGPVGLKTAPEPPRMPTVVPRKAYKQSGGATTRYSLEARPGEKRGHRIDRHLMGRCSTTSSQIVGGHIINDIRRCGGPIGSKRRQKRRSQLILRGFWPFSQREAAHLLPRFLQRVVRLPAPTT